MIKKQIILASFVFAIILSCNKEIDKNFNYQNPSRDLGLNKTSNIKHNADTSIIISSDSVKSTNLIGQATTTNSSSIKVNQDTIIAKDSNENQINNNGIALAIKIENLISNITSLKLSQIEECKTFENEIIRITDYYFEVISEINISDTSNISKLNQMESFAGSIDDSLDKIDSLCPDLYNDYMDYLDDLIDLHYDKLNMIFYLE